MAETLTRRIDVGEDYVYVPTADEPPPNARWFTERTNGMVSYDYSQGAVGASAGPGDDWKRRRGPEGLEYWRAQPRQMVGREVTIKDKHYTAWVVSETETTVTVRGLPGGEQVFSRSLLVRWSPAR